MQTFLPYESFIESAACLDRARLGKQRVEAKQILQTLQKGQLTCKHCKESQIGYATDFCPVNTVHVWQPTAWFNHPAVQMWRGYDNGLAEYGLFICDEWKRRGYKDTLYEWFSARYRRGEANYPAWLGNAEFHLSHRSNLVRKFPEHYRQFWPDVPVDLKYVWPVGDNK